MTARHIAHEENERENTYARLADGSWGIRGFALQPGDRVLVTRRDGQRHRRVIGRIVKRYDDGNTIGTIVPATTERRETGPRESFEYSREEAIEQELHEAREADSLGSVYDAYDY